MLDPERKRSRILPVLRWLVAGAFGLISAVAMVAFVVANTDLTQMWARSGSQSGGSYRYAVFGVMIAEGYSREGVDVQAEYFRCQSFHVGGSLLLAVAVGLLVGGLVFFLWRPIFESSRRDVE